MMSAATWRACAMERLLDALLLVSTYVIDVHVGRIRRLIDWPAGAKRQVGQHEKWNMVLRRSRRSSRFNSVAIEDGPISLDRNAVSVKVLVQRSGRYLVAEQGLIGPSILSFLPNMDHGFV